MTSKKKTEYTRIGLALNGVAVDNYHAELIWRTNEGIEKKKGEFSISDAVDIKYKMDRVIKARNLELKAKNKTGEQ